MYHVAILANLKTNAPHLPDLPADIWADLDSEKTVNAIAQALQAGGHRTTFIEANAELPDRLREVKPDICFNLAEGHFGESREAQAPAVLDLMRIPYTGSGVITHVISLNKAMTKRVWQSYRLRTAPFQQFNAPTDPLEPDLHFPLFVKPLREGTSAGISADSIVYNAAQLVERVTYVIERYRQPALVEAYLAGPEYTVGVLGNPPLQYAFPPLAIDTTRVAPQEQGLYSRYVKSEIDDALSYISTPELPEALERELTALAIAGHNAIGTLDVSRVDIRCDEDHVPYLMEINTLPGLSPGFSDLALAADAVGMGYTWLINTILKLACQRFGLPIAEPIQWPQR